MHAMKLAIPLFVALAYGPSQGLAAPIILGSNLASFAVLGAAGVTNVPVSTIGGNLGSAPNPSVGGGYIFTAGSFQQNTALAQNAQLELDDAIVDVNAFGPGITIPVSVVVGNGNLDDFQDTNGGTIGPGTYTVLAQSVNLVGALVLDGGGSNTAEWVFLFPSTLITSTSSTVTVQNVGSVGGAGVGLYWSVGTAATLNGLTFAGNVLAHDLISSDGDLTIACGRLLSAETKVTLIHDKISIGCGGTGFEESGGFARGVDSIGGVARGVDIGSGGTGGSGGLIVFGVPEPATLLLLGFGLAGLFAFRKKFFAVA